MSNYATPGGETPVGEMTHLMLDRLHHAIEAKLTFSRDLRALERSAAQVRHRLKETLLELDDEINAEEAHGFRAALAIVEEEFTRALGW